MTSREAAYKILYKFSISRNINLKEELEEVLPFFSKREDRSLITHIVYGGVRHLLKIKWIVDKVLEGKKASKKIEPLLWIGIYSFLEFERIPYYATVSELVEIAKKIEGKPASRFVNAILRKYLRVKNKIYLPDDPSIMYSYPRWFIKRWKKRLPYEYIQFLKANNEIPPESIRVNTLKITPLELKNILVQEGVKQIKDGKWDDSLQIFGYPYIQDLSSYKKGYFTVQDEGAMWVSRVVSPLPGEKILDLCSSPGGKAFHMATIMQNKGEIYTVDIKNPNIILEGAKRLGINIIKPLQFDIKKKLIKFYNVFDRVLLDAPCTSLGTIRRRPELKWKKTEKDIRRISVLQTLLLENASLYVRPGGILVYSVCTLEEEETEKVLEIFLKNHSEYSLLGNPLYLYPHKYNTDGFFIIRMKKNS